MRVLFDMVDTAHVHFFRNIIARLQSEGHQVMVTARKKDITLWLLEKYGIEYHCISNMGKGLAGLGWELISRDIKLLRLARKFKPDIMLAKNSGVSIGIVGALLRVPRLVWEDTEHATLQRWIGLPFANRIITGNGYLKDYGKKQRHFKGIWNQAYLDPDVFTPDPEILHKSGIDPDQPYIVIRTVAWEAAHDIGHKGITPDNLRNAIQKLEKFGRIIISSEVRLPEDLKKYENPLPPEHVHHLLAHCSLYLGEGGSMSSETAILGRPSVFCNPLVEGCGCLLALEKDYDLLRCTDSFEKGIEIAHELLSQPDIMEKWQKKRQRFLSESGNLNQYLMDQIAEMTISRKK